MAMTYDKFAKILEKMDDACVEQTGRSFGAYAIGNAHCLEIEHKTTLWSDEDDDDLTAEETILIALRDLHERVGLAITALPMEPKGNPPGAS